MIARRADVVTLHVYERESNNNKTRLSSIYEDVNEIIFLFFFFVGGTAAGWCGRGVGGINNSGTAFYGIAGNGYANAYLKYQKISVRLASIFATFCQFSNVTRCLNKYYLNVVKIKQTYCGNNNIIQLIFLTNLLYHDADKTFVEI